MCSVLGIVVGELCMGVTLLPKALTCMPCLAMRRAWRYATAATNQTQTQLNGKRNQLYNVCVCVGCV